VETTARSGVIVAHGGATVGYALYLKDGRPVFAVRTSGRDVARATGADPLPPRAAVRATLAADGAMALFVNDAQVATGKAGGLLGRQPQEPFCVGHDSRVTVDAYDGAARLQGVVRDLSVGAGTAPPAP
ncbi:MAG TPA: hypothetical protein VF796_10735, partial [Humisphaera sp.]